MYLLFYYSYYYYAYYYYYCSVKCEMYFYMYMYTGHRHTGACPIPILECWNAPRRLYISRTNFYYYTYYEDSTTTRTHCPKEPVCEMQGSIILMFSNSNSVFQIFFMH